jgi:four helix bundle protein
MDNLAEGFDRGSRGEFIQFLGYAKGSGGEVKSQLYRAFDNDYLTLEEFNSLLERTARASAQIKGLLTYLNGSSLKGERYQKAEEPAVSYNSPELPDFLK